MDKLNEDLQDVTRIMTKNMEDLLWRGDSLDREFLPEPFRTSGGHGTVHVALVISTRVNCRCSVFSFQFTLPVLSSISFHPGHPSSVSG